MVTQYFVSGWGGLATYWNKYIATFGPLKGKYIKISSEKVLTKVPKKIHLKKTSLFNNKSSGTELANVLKNIGGSNNEVKPRNKNATKPKKASRLKRRKNKK